MRELHFLAGLPRSGSTLLGNLLAQHPDVHVTGTSAVATCIGQVQQVLTNSPEITADLTNVPGAAERYRRGLRGLLDGWYADVEKRVVVDKSRAWASHRLLTADLLPGSIVICPVRDPRDVIASIERRHRDSALFASPNGPDLREAASALMSPGGMVGAPIRAIEDLLRRDPPGVVFVRYESFVENPAPMLAGLERMLGLDPCAHDLEDVRSIATDLDTLYRGKYPHDGSGPVKPSPSRWVEVLPPALGAEIAGVAPLFMQTFGYDRGT